MEVILLEKIRHLGQLGEQIKVKPGFARNYLIPQGKAVYATAQNIAKFQAKRAELEKIASEKHAQAVAKQQQLAALPPLTIAEKAGDEGRLFGSVGAKDIAEAVVKAGVNINKHNVILPEGSLRLLGDYPITIELENNVSATIQIRIASYKEEHQQKS